MHLSDISMDRIQCSEVFASYSVCPLTADTSWVPFSTLFTSIYIPFTWIKSHHCVFTQSITCSLLTFDTNLTFLSISSVTPRRDRRGCVISRLMTRLAGYYAQLSLMMIGIDAISHGFLRTSFRNRGPPAASFENVWAAWTTNPISNRSSVLTPFPKRRRLMIFWLIFSQHPKCGSLMCSNGLAMTQISTPMFLQKQPNLTAVS